MKIVESAKSSTLSLTNLNPSSSLACFDFLSTFRALLDVRTSNLRAKMLVEEFFFVNRQFVAKESTKIIADWKTKIQNNI